VTGGTAEKAAETSRDGAMLVTTSKHSIHRWASARIRI
jgi:hypothetical protein